MRMPVMCIRNMWMHMFQGFMSMYMAVEPYKKTFMCVQMMPVIMGVGMFMLNRIVVMFMPVRLQQVQHDTGQHQCTSKHHQPRAFATAQCKCAQSTNERRKGKHRASAPSAKLPLS